MPQKKLLILFVFALFTKKFTAQNIVPAGKEINFVNYTLENGLPNAEVFRVFEDSKGYLWVFTKDGLSRFDGINFERFTEKNGLPSNIVTGACEDNNKVIWISTSKGIVIYKNKRFDTALFLPKIIFMNMFKAKDGTIWASSKSGIFHLDPAKPKKPLMKHYLSRENLKNNGVRNIWQNKKGQIMIGGEEGCFVIRNDSMVRYNNLSKQVYNMLEFDDGTEWFTGWEQPVSVYKNGKFERTFSLGGAVLDMLRDSKGNIWLATWDHGVFKYNAPASGTEEKKFIHYSAKEGLSHNSFWGINEDSQGNVWFSSWGGGIFKYSGESFTRLTEKSGLGSNNVMGVLEDNDGNFWINSEQSITKYEPVSGKLKTFDNYNGSGLSFINYLFEYKPHEIWALGYSGMGYKIINDKIIQDKELTGFDAIKDTKGNIWIATDKHGVLKISGNEKTYIDVRPVQSNDRIVTVREDKLGNIWFTNEEKGIHLFRNNELKNCNKSNGFRDEPAEMIVQEDNGYYWITIKRKGIYKCSLENNSRLKIIDSLNVSVRGLYDNITAIAIYNYKLYVSTTDGLCIADPAAKDNKNIRYFGKEEGLLNNSCFLTVFDKSGRLWLRTTKGVYIFDSNQDKKNEKESKTHITGVDLFFEKTDWSAYAPRTDEYDLPVDLKLPYQKNHLTFNFIGINLVAPSKVLYQYRLNGLENEWSPPTNKREATYSSIPPGTYTFMVKSCNNDDVWNKEPQNFIFTITPPFYKTGWFYIIIILFTGSSLFFFIKFREKALLKEKMVLEEKINDRTHQLKEAVKEIELKQKEITDSINYASKIQSALMPSQKDIESLGSESFIIFKPKDIVSGDFYWAEKIENRTYLAVCDSTGHGVPGAFMSLLNINYINKAINELNISEPNEIFNSIRMDLINGISKEGQKDGFDGVLFCFDKKYNEVTYAAANNRPILISNNAIINLPADKMPVGKGEKENSFSLNKIEPQKGDALYLFTDGFIDQFGGPKGKKFMYKQLEEILLSIHHLPFEKQKEILNKKFEGWKGSLEQVDDVCLIGIRI
jgi:ligand-binding sensor domain-containing protein/serine phosphatase RsbU (regulator of sigma subunit)